MYVSQDTCDPSRTNCQLSLELDQISRMNRNGKNMVTFGNELSRDKKVYPNSVFITVIATIYPVVLYFKVVACHSKEFIL